MAKTETTSKKLQAGCKIAKCLCSNTYQDEKYGAGNRVFNMKAKEGKRCTSCGKDSV